jgi:NADPH2:quinone reductase
MSSVAALGIRGRLVAGESVLILGATGSAGQLSVQVARAMGARRVVAAGRNVEALARLEVDAVTKIDATDFSEQVTRELTANRIDVVLDYLWGSPAEVVLTVLASRAVGHRSHRTRFVQVGEMAGPAISLPGWGH